MRELEAGSSRGWPVLSLALLAIGCGGDSPSYDLEALPKETAALSMLRQGPLRVGTIRAEVDGESREWPALVDAGYRRGSGWERTESADGTGARGSARLRGDARADDRFEIDFAFVLVEGGRFELESPIRLRAALAIDGERTALTFIPAPDDGVVLEKVEPLSSGKLVVEGRFSGTLNHASIEPIVVVKGSFEARLPGAESTLP